MLSNVSGFTQSSAEDEMPLPRITQDIIERERQESGGSSNASGTSGSVGDPKSPVTGSGLNVGVSTWKAPWNENRVE
jgi:hypothetical protein